MRRSIIIALAIVVAIAGCKKKTGTVSVVNKASYPVITITGSQYVSIPVGGAFTPPSATAIDTYYNEHPSVVKDLGTLDNTTPGLYTVTYSAKNHNGFVGTAVVYVAVTNINDTLDLSGTYLRAVTPTKVAFVTKLARGLFYTTNVGGVDTVVSASAVVPAVFAVTSLTTIDFGTQPTIAGPLSCSNQVLSLAPADTSLTYIITSPGSVFSTTAVRQLVKQ